MCELRLFGVWWRRSIYKEQEGWVGLMLSRWSERKQELASKRVWQVLDAVVAVAHDGWVGVFAGYEAWRVATKRASFLSSCLDSLVYCTIGSGTTKNVAGGFFLLFFQERNPQLQYNVIE